MSVLSVWVLAKLEGAFCSPTARLCPVLVTQVVRWLGLGQLFCLLAAWPTHY